MMYRFRLEPVLRHRKLVEEELQRELGALRKQLLVEEERLSELKGAKTKFSRELEERAASGMNAADAQIYVDFLQQVSRDMENQWERILKAKKGLDEKREELVRAMKGRKIIERLREKGLHAHLLEEAKKEQDLIDETAVNLFNRKP